jgi:DNA-binding response OmpR family regulator
MSEPFPRILIVEDDAEEIELLIKFLTRSYKCDIDVACELEEVKRWLEKKDYDFIITDAFVRDFTAGEVAIAVKEKKSSPIIYLFSGDENPELIKKFFEDGIDIHFRKGFKEMENMLISIRNIFSKLKGR